MEVTKMLVPKNKYNIKCPYEMTPEYITVHNTANNASAKSEVTYMINNNKEVSYHCAIDNTEIVQAIEFNRNAWHAGDGEKGTGNRKSIGIEICYSTSPDEQIFLDAELLASKYIAYLLKQYNWGIDRVKKHQDWSNKYCPHHTLDLGWERFLNLIQVELGEKQQVEQKQEKNNNTEQNYTGVITYQVYTNKWLPEVYKCDNTSEGYAGIYGNAISGIKCKPQYGEIIYESHIKGGNWLSAVNSKDYSNNNDNSYSGIYGKPIDAIRITSTKGYVEYRTHLKNGNWLDWVDSRTKEGTESYAGIIGKEIDGIQMK